MKKLTAGVLLALLIASVGASSARADGTRIVAIPDAPGLAADRVLVVTGPITPHLGFSNCNERSMPTATWGVVIGNGRGSHAVMAWEGTSPSIGSRWSGLSALGTCNRDGATYYLYSVQAQ